MTPLTRIQLFVTCLVEALRPEVGLAVVDVLEALGLTVDVAEGQTCCGQPAHNGGFHPEAVAMARHTVDVLSRSEAPIVTPSGSCADMLIHHYPRLLGDDPAYAERAAAVAGRTYEFSQLLVHVLGVTGLGAHYQGRLTYHPSCHLLRGLGIVDAPVRLLAEVEGAEVAEMPGATECCGFGGLFAVKMSDISGAMLRRKLEAVEQTGAPVVVGCDVSCLLHIGGGLHRRGSAVQTRHLAEILSSPHLRTNDDLLDSS